jgi:predicted  nucleic acid-binding Zn-ribbon protein
LSTKQGDDEVKKLEGRLNTVRNNAEYQATLLQIESVKRERDRAQDEAIGLLERLEEHLAARDQARAALKADEATFAEFQEEAAKLRAAREAEAARIGVGREKLLEGLPPDLLDKYTKLFKSRQRIAVAPVELQVCQGCYNRVTVNDIARLRGGSSVVECGSCNRILYIRDDA